MVGLSIHDDFRALHKLSEFEPAAYVELQGYVKQFDIADNSLQKIYAILFGKRISKGQRLTNWEADVLTESQQAYASLDAKACLQIYEYLASKKFDKDKSQYIVKDSE